MKAFVFAAAGAALGLPFALAVAGGGAPGAEEAPTREQQVIAGRTLYEVNCASCHLPDGSGVAGEIPPLAGSDFLAKGPDHAIAVVLHGLRGQLRVHGQGYDSAMPPLYRLSNEEVADVLTFVYNSWGNPGGQVHASDVAAQRYDRTLAPEEE